jgi:von Willebrand factor type A domain
VAFTPPRETVLLAEREDYTGRFAGRALESREADCVPLSSRKSFAARRLGHLTKVTMQRSSPHAAPASKRLLPAWAFSVLFHSCLIVLLGLAAQPTPRGAAEEPGRSAGIVLKRASAEGDLYEGEESLADDADADQAQPLDLASVLPSETAAASVGEDLPQEPLPGAGTPVGGGLPDASQFTSGDGRRGSPSGSGQARLSVFGVEGSGNKFVYLFDRSSSMEGPPLAAAKRQLIESLNALESVHQFHIIFFNTRTQAFDITGGGRRIAFATDRNRQLAANFVGGIVADGGTDRLVALREALSFAPDVIFFLTDADDPMSASELASIERANRRSQTAICVIEFGRRLAPSPGNFLSELAHRSGGQYGYVNVTRLGQ